MTEREMMEEAMETVEREYSVVGVTERFNDSLQVMEKYLPGDTYTKLDLAFNNVKPKDRYFVLD